MQKPLEIVYRGVFKNTYLDSLVRKKVAKLERACPYMVSCQVMLEKDQKQQRTNNEYKIRLDVRVPPNHKFSVSRKTLVAQERKDLPPTLREVFAAMERKLKDLSAQQKGKMKSHPQQITSAIVDRLVPEGDFGYLRTTDGQEIWFHRNSVVNIGFDDLKVGAGVAFELAEDGGNVRASSVRVLDRS